MTTKTKTLPPPPLQPLHCINIINDNCGKKEESWDRQDRGRKIVKVFERNKMNSVISSLSPPVFLEIKGGVATQLYHAARSPAQSGAAGPAPEEPPAAATEERLLLRILLFRRLRCAPRPPIWNEI